MGCIARSIPELRPEWASPPHRLFLLHRGRGVLELGLLEEEERERERLPQEGPRLREEESQEPE